MQTQINELNFSGHNIYVGIDAHLKNWRVTVMLNGIMEKSFSQDPNAEKLQEYLHKRYPGANYYSAYEAGFCGFSVHRSLERAGIKNIVVNPADIPVTDKEKKQKEDKRDSIKIARTLHNGELKGIHVPKRETEELRTFVRYRKTLVKETADISAGPNRYCIITESAYRRSINPLQDIGQNVLPTGSGKLNSRPLGEKPLWTRR